MHRAPSSPFVPVRSMIALECIPISLTTFSGSGPSFIPRTALHSPSKHASNQVGNTSPPTRNSKFQLFEPTRIHHTSGRMHSGFEFLGNSPLDVSVNRLCSLSVPTDNSRKPVETTSTRETQVYSQAVVLAVLIKRCCANGASRRVERTLRSLPFGYSVNRVAHSKALC